MKNWKSGFERRKTIKPLNLVFSNVFHLMPMKTKFYLASLFVFHLLAASIHGQPVVFLNQNDLLTNVTGFAEYSDCVVDMNGDRLDDVVRVAGKGIYIDFQQSDGTFQQRFFNVHLATLPTWSICAGDLDNNGFNDLLLASSESVSFVTADSSGTKYSEQLMPVTIASQRSTMADINNDGWLDAFVCNDTALSIPFRNDGFGKMIPETNLIETSPGPGAYSAIWTDFDNDSDIDLYITKCKAGAPPSDPDRINLLYRNNGDDTFTEVAAAAGLDDNAQSWTTSFEDFDNDGDMDAFIINHDFQNRLFRNNGNGTFTDVISTSGIDAFDLGAFENSTGDFNNDGFMDIFSDLGQQLYLGNGDLTFTGQTLPVTPGAIADLNNDGFLDVVHQGDVFINQGNEHHWIKLIPHGLVTNRNGIGARVELYVAGEKQIREVRSGQSYSPMSSLAVHFGLGDVSEIDSIIVRWPSGIRTKLDTPHIDTTYTLPEATCLLEGSEISVAGDTNLCPGDTLMLTAPFGFPLYTWSTGETTQSILISGEGLFHAIVQDSNGCISLTNSIHVRAPQELIPTITASNSNHLCAGETIFLISSPGVNYLWADGSTAQSIAVTESGTYTVAVDGICSETQIVSEPYDVVFLEAAIPVLTSIEHTPEDSVIIVVEGSHISWYDEASGGLLLDTGNILIREDLNHSVTYYAESHTIYPEQIFSGGKADTTGPGGLPDQTGYLLFDIWEPITLLSVDAYVPEGGPAGTRFIQLYEGDTLLDFVQVVVQPGLNTVPLNFEIPIGKYSLRSPQGNLFRNRGELSYPYFLGQAGQITSSSFGDEYYYFFYNWQLRTPEYECVSKRLPVEIIVIGQENISDVASWHIYPNPSAGEVWLEFSRNETGSIIVSNELGQRVLSREFVDQQLISLKFPTTNTGIYLVQVRTKETVLSRKLLITQKG